MNKKHELVPPRTYIFQVKPERTSASLKVVGYIDDGPCADESIEKRELSEGLSVKFNKNNITDAYILTSKRLPVMTASVVFQKPFIYSILMVITIYFEITSDLSSIKNFKDMLNTKFDGNFSSDIIVDEMVKTTPQRKFLGYNNTIENTMELLKTEEMKKLIDGQIKRRDDERKEKYGSIDQITIPVPKYKMDDLVDAYERGENIKEILKK